MSQTFKIGDYVKTLGTKDGTYGQIVKLEGTEASIKLFYFGNGKELLNETIVSTNNLEIVDDLDANPTLWS